MINILEFLKTSKSYKKEKKITLFLNAISLFFGYIVPNLIMFVLIFFLAVLFLLFGDYLYKKLDKLNAKSLNYFEELKQKRKTLKLLKNNAEYEFKNYLFDENILDNNKELTVETILKFKCYIFAYNKIGRPKLSRNYLFIIESFEKLISTNSKLIEFYQREIQIDEVIEYFTTQYELTQVSKNEFENFRNELQSDFKSTESEENSKIQNLVEHKEEDTEDLILTEPINSTSTKNYNEQKGSKSSNPKVNPENKEKVKLPKARKVFWEKINQHRNNIGKAGELLVFELEKNKLYEMGKPELVAKIVHVAVELGDGLGYDIKSFDEDENEIFIEVKSSVKDNGDMFLSRNELNTIKEKDEKYYIYRISNLDIDEKSYDLEIIQGKDSIFSLFNIIPNSYVVKPK
jgi:hypothetical protein